MKNRVIMGDSHFSYKSLNSDEEEFEEDEFEDEE